GLRIDQHDPALQELRGIGKGAHGLPPVVRLEFQTCFDGVVADRVDVGIREQSAPRPDQCVPALWRSRSRSDAPYPAAGPIPAVGCHLSMPAQHCSARVRATPPVLVTKAANEGNVAGCNVDCAAVWAVRCALPRKAWWASGVPVF